MLYRLKDWTFCLSILVLLLLPNYASASNVAESSDIDAITLVTKDNKYSLGEIVTPETNLNNGDQYGSHDYTMSCEQNVITKKISCSASQGINFCPHCKKQQDSQHDD